jgi:hypothetical protein
MNWVYPYSIQGTVFIWDISRRFSSHVFSTHLMPCDHCNLGMEINVMPNSVMFYCCCIGSTLWHLQTFLHYIIVEFTILLYFLLPPFLGSHFSTVIHYMRLPLHSTSSTLSLYPPSSYWYQSPRQDMFCLPVFHF